MQKCEVVHGDDLLVRRHRQVVERNVQDIETKPLGLERDLDAALPVDRAAAKRDKTQAVSPQSLARREAVVEHEELVAIGGRSRQVANQVLEMLLIAAVPNADEVGVDADPHQPTASRSDRAVAAN